MHPSLDELLSVRDGEPVAAATRQHAMNCVACSASLRRLTQRQQALQGLEQFEAPDIEFASITARSLQVTQSAAAPAHRWWAAAAAAAIVATVIGSFVLIERDRQSSELQSQAVPLHQPAVAEPEPLDAQLARLVQQSRELDQLLHNMPPRPEVQRVSLAGMVDRIEQRVQWLDMQLSSVPDSGADQVLAQRLWRERVELMDSLVTVRYAEALPQSFPSDEPTG